MKINVSFQVSRLLFENAVKASRMLNYELEYLIIHLLTNSCVDYSVDFDKK